VISALSHACVDRVRDFNPQDAANCIWAVATLGVTDPHVISSLAYACVAKVKDFNSQDAANSLWAIAKLGVTDPHVISSLSEACVARVRDFNPQDAVTSIWAVATLGVTDPHVISSLSQACVTRVRDFNPQDAVTSIWAVATLGITDPHVISSLSQACVTRVRDFNSQNGSNALWSAAVLSINDKAITNPLTAAVSERFKTITRVDHAQQCLQAHDSGLTLSDVAVKHFHSILLAHPEPTSTSNKQLSVSATLSHLGYSPRLEVPVFNGLVTTDLLIEMPSFDGSGRLIKVSIEFDGPTHYLRPAMGSSDLVGPIDGKTRLRNALLKRRGQFQMLITIPYYEWNEVEGKKERDEEYLKRKLSEGRRD